MLFFKIHSNQFLGSFMMNMCLIMTLGAMGPDESSLMNESYERKTHQKISAGLSAVTHAYRNGTIYRKMEFFKREFGECVFK